MSFYDEYTRSETGYNYLVNFFSAKNLTNKSLVWKLFKLHMT